MAPPSAPVVRSADRFALPPTIRDVVAGDIVVFPQRQSATGPMSSSQAYRTVVARADMKWSATAKGVEMRRLFEIGGFIATAVLIIFGVVAIVMGVNGRNTVQDSLKLEQIVGTPDMNATAIAAEAKKAGLPASIELPTADIAGKPIDSGARAHAFATYMRIHALEATGGQPYAQLPRFATADGKGTSDPTKALTQNGKPVDNPIRQVWITETALSTALNASYLAENVAMFGIVVGIALVLTGVGFGVLVIGGSLRGRESALQGFGKRTPEAVGAKTVPTA
jgi:hypothetical protein